jgi:predicted ATPase
MQPENKLIHFIERLIDGDGQVVLQASDGQGYTMSEVFGGVKEDVQLINALVFASFPGAVVSPQGEITYIERRGQMYSFVSKRWQILRENFMPPTSVPTDEYHDPYSIERSGRNVPTMLDFMQKTNRAVYDELQSDMRWLLNHVDNLEVETNERETRYDIVEKVLQGQKGPTTSTGTARILAMLTAYYALDLRNAEFPGLLVIEEPDTAVHPALLKRLVELFREYVNREGYPRQIMVTTHNPQFLNWFEPEEVRVVERDEDGDTSVHEIPTYIKEIWLDSGEYGLGDVWMTRSLGGVPE